MTAIDRAPIVDDLDRALERSLKLVRAASVTELLKPGRNPRYVRDLRLTFAEHFDVNPAFFILDSLLGTVGLVETVWPDGSSADQIAEEVRRCVDRATYLRHLLLRDPEKGSRRPLSVELVLLTADEPGPTRRGLDAIGDALRNVLRDTDSLFHIGVGVLHHDGSALGGDGRLRRTFPWLLAATRRWMQSDRAQMQKATDARSRGRLRQITLTDYRLPGVREIVLTDSRVHLMHGPNGSGKSSIVEALEILTSGKVERLDQAGETQYDTVIRNSSSTGPASVSVGWSADGSPNVSVDEPRHVLTNTIELPLAPGVDASSFRLDQPLMDRLVGRFPHERARIFLRAFFPEAIESLDKYEQAAREHELAVAALQPLVQQLSVARAALVNLQTWRGGASTPTQEEFPVLLNAWLEQTVLVDLVKRERLVRETVQAAESAGWKPSSPMAPIVAALGDSAAAHILKGFEDEGIKAVDDLQRKLASFRPSVTSTTADVAPPAVSHADVEVLNAVCRFLVSEDVLQSLGPLGHKLAAVINAGDANTYGPVIIGSENWASPLVEAIDRLLAACEGLRAEDVVAPTWPGFVASTEYDAARQFQERRNEAGRALTADFADKLRPDTGAQGEFDGSLIAALNELLALFTPARWAYADIQLPPELGKGKLGLPIHVKNAANKALRAELRLNTAELNLFTVGLFLLCIGRVQKPLNLLILDDPLQNMDELTSVALARGLAKIVRLWADLARREELLLLFHGHDDLERFSAEVAAATYKLPWLSPNPSQPWPPIRAGGNAGDVLAVQSLGNLSPLERK